MEGFNVRSMATGDLVFQEGEAADSAFLVLSGRVALARETEHGTIPLAVFGDRQIFGEVAVIDEGQRDCLAQAIEDGQIVPIPAQTLQAQLEQSPPMIRTIVRSLVTQLSRAQQRLQPEQDRNLFLATAHLLYQMAIALKADGTNSLPLERAMRVLTTVLGRSAPEVEAVLETFDDLRLIGWTTAGTRMPHLTFLVQDGFLGKALRHYDETGGGPPPGEADETATQEVEA